MKNIIMIALIGIMTIGVFVPYSVQAQVQLTNTAQIEQIQKLLIQLRARLALISPQKEITNQNASISYERQTNNVDEKINKYGVTFVYQDAQPCKSVQSSYTISFGDGKSAKADCKGVAEHVYKKDGTYTAKYTKRGKVLATVKVVINNSEKVPVTAPVSLYASPDVTATMTVVSAGNRTIKASGVITPPKNCVGSEPMDVEVLFTPADIIPYGLYDCQPKKFELSHTYDSSSDFAFPEIRIRWLDARYNSWTYTQLEHYKVDFTWSDTNPQIIKLVGGTKG